MVNFHGANIKTGRRLTPPMPMGYTHERPPRCGGGWACTSGGGCRRPCGLSSGALSREHVNRKHTAPVRLIVCADLLLGEVREFLTIAACLKCPRAVPVVVPNDHVYHFFPFRIVILGAWKCVCCTTAFFLLPSSGRLFILFSISQQCSAFLNS